MPSGRLIQVEDYFKEGFLEKGFEIEDTLFLSKTGRELKGGGGITPDIIIKNEEIPPYVNAIWNSGALTNFAAEYYVEHPELKNNLYISRKTLNDFKEYLSSYNIKYVLKGEKALEKLKTQLKETGISNKINYISYEEQKIIDEMETYFERLRFKQFNLHHNIKWVKSSLLRKFSKVIFGSKEEVKASLYDDDGYEKACEILLRKKKYKDILNL